MHFPGPDLMTRNSPRAARDRAEAPPALPLVDRCPGVFMARAPRPARARRGVLAMALACMLLPAVAAAQAPAQLLPARIQEALRNGPGAATLSVIANVRRNTVVNQPRGLPPEVERVLNAPVYAPAEVDQIVSALLARSGLAAVVEPPPAGDAPRPSVDAVKAVDDFIAAVTPVHQAWAQLAEEAGRTLDDPDVRKRLDDGDMPRALLRRLETYRITTRAQPLAAVLAEAVVRLTAALDPQTVGEPGRRMAGGITVITGSASDDVHDLTGIAGDVILLDPGGNDRYEFGPSAPGSLRVVVDLAGDDIYAGDAMALLTAVAIADRDGNDAYEAEGIAGTIGGVALALDGGGDDRYEARRFGQAAAVAGVALLSNDSGSDSYTIGFFGQGFAGPLGIAVLHDGAGDDRYRAAGPGDRYGRNGRISMAQGMGYGEREGVAGGIGILLDDAGNDSYGLSMFGQGAGYGQGFGLLRDRSGNDTYDGVRYAQGQGSHGGVGILAEGDGEDTYVLEFGVGQGMGLDLAVGILHDAAGLSSVRGGTLAQGAATANGVGIAILAGESNLSIDGQGWGEPHGARGLPGVALLLASARNMALYGESAKRAAWTSVGPLGGAPPVVEGPTRLNCPAPAGPIAPLEDPRHLLRLSAPVGGEGAPAEAAYRRLAQAMPGALADLMRGVETSEALAINLSGMVRCWMAAGGAPAKAQAFEIVSNRVVEGVAAQAWLPVALLQRSGAAPLSVVQKLLAHRDCSARAGAISLVRRDVTKYPAEFVQAMASAALTDPCWQAQAAGLRLVDETPMLADLRAAGTSPGFLRDPARRASLRAPDLPPDAP